MDRDLYIKCPFCGEEDFDPNGLKHHLESGYCDAYNEIVPYAIGDNND